MSIFTLGRAALGCLSLVLILVPAEGLTSTTQTESGRTCNRQSATQDLSNPSICERVRDILEHRFDIEHEKLVPEAMLVDDLGMDELDIIEFIIEVKNEFEIQVPDDASEAWTTLARVCSYLEQHPPYL